jgi:hypothetical protein
MLRENQTSYKAPGWACGGFSVWPIADSPSFPKCDSWAICGCCRFFSRLCSAQTKETPSLFPLERHTSGTKAVVTRRGETNVKQFGFANLTAAFVERAFPQEEKGGTSAQLVYNF